jgi:hypothetical protein
VSCSRVINLERQAIASLMMVTRLDGMSSFCRRLLDCLVILSSCMIGNNAFDPGLHVPFIRPLSLDLHVPTALESSRFPHLDDETMKGLMDVAIKASRKAGDIIREHSKGVKVHKWKANSRDLLTSIDSLCEKVCFCAFCYFRLKP